MAEADLKADICDEVYTHDNERLRCDVLCHCLEGICTLTVFWHAPRLDVEGHSLHGKVIVCMQDALLKRIDPLLQV